jgi:hypothetical protein
VPVVLIYFFFGIEGGKPSTGCILIMSKKFTKAQGQIEKKEKGKGELNNRRKPGRRLLPLAVNILITHTDSQTARKVSV